MIIKLTGKLTGIGQLTGAIQRISGGDHTPYYEGEYVVIPASSEQVLETAGLKMHDDVTVEEIPYAEVSNPQGGYTVTIGG